MMLGKEEDRKPIGLFFGSFNPIHNGHVGIARYLLEKKLCAEVWFVVSPCNPFKVDRFLLPETDRLAIVSAAIGGIPGMKAPGLRSERLRQMQTENISLKAWKPDITG